MRLRRCFLIVAFAFASLHSGDTAEISVRTRAVAARNFERIKFHIVTVEEKGSERRIVSESIIDGPPNTDFKVTLDDPHFKMSAGFLTDLIRPDRLRVRAKLDTRRLYGSSERNLRLYEEDEQSQSLEVGFDEVVVLLPFGRGGGDHRLKIEITPAISSQTSTSRPDEARPLEINILRPSPGGIVRFEASKIPHNFVADLVILEDGREIASSPVSLLIEEEQEVVLQPKQGTADPIVVKLVIQRYTRSRPADQVTFDFDIYRQNTSSHKVGPSGAGVASLGSTTTYDIAGHNLGSVGSKYELKVKFNLAPGEQAD